ncbi:ATP-binding protein [Phyllobacterium sp. 628]|uniref:ATP-binding protein n=1 Tax=Phyllobacterium sp. 628 TaxID=2718938 RepID=UPI0016623B5F|nr:ATP-binding protein [Phyllobacterium sp. 628]QND53838.1 ATP-binding protein [Phyllobacterium sp. 628]
MYPRFSAQDVEVALSDSRVVLIAGPRQAGKSTLARAASNSSRSYFTLDDETTLDAAKSDPKGFVRGLDLATIDEIQRAPGLLLAIKESVDEDKRPGRFLLTGSANIMTLPTVADSLAGRMEVITLMPLARGEIVGRKPTFLDLAFQGRIAPGNGASATANELIEVVLAGGYPEAIGRSTPNRRTKWYLDYINAIIQRDVRDIADIGRIGDMPRLIRLFVNYSAKLINFSEIGAALAMDRKTVQRYLDIFSALYITHAVEPWHNNLISRLTKSPKLHFLDSGLLAAVLGVSLEGIKSDRTVFGHLLESFVFSELVKQIGWLQGRGISINHFRTTTRTQDEVDFVLEDNRGGIVGIEVKASATVVSDDFRGMRKLAEVTKSRFIAGILTYDGDKVVPFGSNMFAVPVSHLWT